MIFQHPYWLLASVFLLACAFIYRTAGVRSAWHKVMSPEVLGILNNKLPSDSLINKVLLAAAIVAAALSAPSTRNDQSDAFQHTDGWFLLADLSRSMTMTDVLPSRLSAMRSALTDLTKASGAKATALIIYTADAFMVVPPSFDKQQLTETTALLDYGAIEQDGSNLTRAISLAVSSIAQSGMTQARVFVLSDTGGISNNAIAAAKFLAGQGHRLDLILFGNPQLNSDANQQLDITLATQLAKAGRGLTIQSDSLGSVDLSNLSLNHDNNAIQNAAQRAIHWHNQSHWLLLLLLPLFPSIYRDYNAS